MEIDNQLSVHHLVKAYKEAMENQEAELAEVITRRISKKVGPTGEIKERLLYYSFQPLDKETDYLTQESAKNFDKALEAFYKIFPDGMISHFTANSVILEAKPRDADVCRTSKKSMQRRLAIFFVVALFASLESPPSI
jgi:hypothetical protein